MRNPFTQFNIKILPALSRLWADVQNLKNMRGSEFINVKRAGDGITLGLNLDAARRRISRNGDDGGFGTNRLAVCTQDAGIGSTITANICSVSSGVIQTTGIESGVDVYCNITNGTALNEAVRRLEIGDFILVTKLVYDNSGTPEIRWYYVGGFQASVSCECEAP